MPQINLIDRYDLDAASIVRKTREGYLVARPRVARTGVQVYRGTEVGKPELDQVAVYRDEKEVFAKDSMATFAHRPITDDHPREPLTADTWADHAIGQMGDEVARDGEFVRVGTLIMDAGAISKIEDGKSQLSVGYSCDLVWEDGVSPQGVAYQARQVHIAANHLALVGLARGGPELRIGDEQVMATRKVLVDGLPFDLEDNAANIVEKLIKDRDTATALVAGKDAKIGELTTAVATKDTEITTLKADAAKNVITPQMIDERVAAKLAVAANAKKIMGDAFTTDGKEADAIKVEVVNAKLGDAAKPFTIDGKPNMDMIGAAFTSLLAAVPADGNTGVDSIRDGLRHGVVTQTNAGDKAWQETQDREKNAWKTPEPKTA